MRRAHGTGLGATHPSAGVRDLGRGWTTPGGFRATLACCGARGSRRLCWIDSPGAAKVYSAQIGSSRETRFVSNSQDSVIFLTAVPPPAFRGSMKPGGRRAGEVACHNTGFSPPSNARGRRSLGRQSGQWTPPPTRGGLDLFSYALRNSHNSPEDIGHGTLIREVWAGSIAPQKRSNEPSANRQWNRSAASRIEEMSGQSHPPRAWPD
jgi:hypothetical protein